MDLMTERASPAYPSTPAQTETLPLSETANQASIGPSMLNKLNSVTSIVQECHELSFHLGQCPGQALC